MRSKRDMPHSEVDIGILFKKAKKRSLVISIFQLSAATKLCTFSTYFDLTVFLMKIQQLGWLCAQPLLLVLDCCFMFFLLTKRKKKHNNIFCWLHKEHAHGWAGRRWWCKRLTWPVAAHKKWELILSSNKSFQTSGEAYLAQRFNYLFPTQDIYVMHVLLPCINTYRI